MIKKIYLLLLISVFIAACGKKSDPIYKNENQNSKILSTQKSTHA